MTPADLAAALGVDVESVIPGRRGHHRCDIDADRRSWSIKGGYLYTAPLRGHGVCIDYPITTTLPAAVAHVRAMLAVPTLKENES
jgi:hypothetical protein